MYSILLEIVIKKSLFVGCPLSIFILYPKYESIISALQLFIQSRIALWIAFSTFLDFVFLSLAILGYRLVVILSFFPFINNNYK